jgi:hypothetical protein
MSLLQISLEENSVQKKLPSRRIGNWELPMLNLGNGFERKLNGECKESYLILEVRHF